MPTDPHHAETASGLNPLTHCAECGREWPGGDISAPAVRSGEVEALPCCPMCHLTGPECSCGAPYVEPTTRGEVDARGLEAARDLVIATARRINSGPYEDVRMTGALAALDAALTATGGGGGELPTRLEELRQQCCASPGSRAAMAAYINGLEHELRAAQRPDAAGGEPMDYAALSRVPADSSWLKPGPLHYAKNEPDAAGGDGVGVTEEMVRAAVEADDQGIGYERVRWMLAAALRHARGAGEWIACSERMPDDRQRVLARTRGQHGSTVMATWEHNPFNPGRHAFACECGWFPPEHFTHWMPLPKPPALRARGGVGE